jgi:V/A-type H+-transporting ATPase subunit K
MNDMKRWCGLAWLVVLLVTLTVGASTRLMAAEEGGGGASAGSAQIGEPELVDAGSAGNKNAVYYAIALTMSVACLAAGYAVGKVGAAAMGVISEKPELVGRVLIFVGLAEGIAIYGLIVSIMLMRKL